MEKELSSLELREKEKKELLKPLVETLYFKKVKYKNVPAYYQLSIMNKDGLNLNM